jgi:uncharacterized protein
MFHLTIEVPTRQGVTLRGLHYAPDSSPAPTVMALTPYGADRFHPHAKDFVARGFHFVSLDTRGRGDSDGRFIPFVHDAADGHDAVEWLAQQPWSGGDVVLYGGSYCGLVQWAIAGSRPAGLRAIAPTASVYPGVDVPIVGNVAEPYVVRWLSLVDGRRVNEAAFLDVSLWTGATRDAIGANRPMRDLDLLTVGKRLPTFQDWLDHPERDECWDSTVPTAQERAEITVPVLTITGQYDDDQLGALTHHDEHIAAAASDVVDRHHVVIGPWDHAGTRSEATSFGGLTFAESSVIGLRELHADWYDWVLGRGPKPEFLADRVVYFHSGEDRWRSQAHIPAGPEFLRLYPLAERSEGHHRVLSSTEPVTTQTVELVADPRNAADDARREPDDSTRFSDPEPLRQTENPSLVYVTAPLPEPVDLSGRFQARLTLAADVPDFDILVGAYRLAEDGTTVLLGESVLRARYRSSLRHADPWPVDTPVPVEVTRFPFISLRTDPGDRLALVVRAPHRDYQPNFQTGGVVSEESIKDAVPGVIQLIQDPAQPSFVAFPLASQQ